jgi:hypothetical protein
MNLRNIQRKRLKLNGNLNKTSNYEIAGILISFLPLIEAFSRMNEEGWQVLIPSGGVLIVFIIIGQVGDYLAPDSEKDNKNN